MQENKKLPTQKSGSFVGTQYLAWALSMLMVFTSTTPVQAAGGKGKTFQLTLQAFKGQPLSMKLNAKLARQLRIATMGKAPLRLMINGQDFTLSTTNATSLTSTQALQVTPDLSTLPATAFHTQPANANFDLSDLFGQIDHVQQLLKLGTPQSRAQAFARLQPLVKQAQEMVRQIQVSSDASLPYLEDVKVSLDKAERVLSIKSPTREDLQTLYQLGQNVSDHFFAGTSVTPNTVKLNENVQRINDLLQQLDELSEELEKASDLNLVLLFVLSTVAVIVAAATGINLIILNHE